MEVHGFFCEDIRFEKGGADTIIGVLRDNMTVPSVPGMIPKLGLYIRIRMNLDDRPGRIETKIKVPWSEEITTVGSTSPEVIASAFNGARTNGLPFAGLVIRAILSPFEVQGYGLISANVVIDDLEYVAALLNIRAKSESTASLPQPSQSPPDAPASS